MKKILSLFVLLSSFCFADEIESATNKPIWEQDQHFQKYQWMMVTCAAIRIKDKLLISDESQISDELKELISNDLDIILKNLGF